jgi:ATP-dependent Clp protease protease subunit
MSLEADFVTRQERLITPQSRYILPEFTERTAYGVKSSNPYSKLFEDRIIFLGVQVDDASADDIMAQLLVLESMDSERDITMYINSPGGSMTALAAIFDTMNYIAPNIQTVCLGQAASAAAVILAAGTKGKRLALKNSRILIHQPAIDGGVRGKQSDLEIHGNEMLRLRDWLETTLSELTGQDIETIKKDIEKDKFLTADDAKKYGILDEVLVNRKPSN